MIRKLTSPTVLTTFLTLSLPLFGAISVPSAVFTYTENFNTLPATGTGATPQAAWSNHSTLLGWYLHAGNNLAADVSAIRVNAGSTSSRSQTSYGTGTSTERALGSQGGSVHDLSASSTAGSIADNSTFGTISAGFTNNSGTPLTGFSFSYTGEQWVRSSSTGTTRDTLTAQWAIGSVSAAPTSLTWNAFTTPAQSTPGVNFTAPQKEPSSTAIDGNATANRITGLGASVAGISWPTGQTLFIRWVDINDSGTDGGLAVDDFSFSVVGLPAGVTAQSLVSKGAVWKYLDNGTNQGTNGREVVRDNMPTGMILSNTFANSPEVGGSNESVFFPHDIAPSFLRVGVNTIAVEIHQQRGDSSDVSFDMDLIATRNDATGSAPTVEITAPANNAIFGKFDTVEFTASATDSNGTVTKVEFYRNTTKLGEVLDAPYTFIWTHAIDGFHAITAIATDNQGNRTISAPITIQATEKPNHGPVLAITSPATAASFTVANTITFSATATDAKGVVERVAFFRDGTLLATQYAAPYTLPVGPLVYGSYVLSAIATDDAGETTTEAVTIQVTNPNNSVPTVALTSPSNGATLPAGAISLTAKASDKDSSLPPMRMPALTMAGCGWCCRTTVALPWFGIGLMILRVAR